MLKRTFIEGADFFKQLYINRQLISELTKREFKTHYADNLFGLLWALIEPLAMMVILWFVFSYLQSGPANNNIPYSLYLLSAIIAYDFFNKSINKGASSIKQYSFLVKTVNFRIATIPIIVISAELIIHLIVIGILLTLLIINGIYPNPTWLQLPYFVLAQYVLLVGISWFTGAIAPFFPDMSYIITIVMRVLFFMTPIFWDPSKMGGNFAFIVKLNPFAYIVNGYRDSVLYNIPFWNHPCQTLYFWAFTGIIYIIGIIVFKRLRPHFADVV